MTYWQGLPNLATDNLDEIQNNGVRFFMFFASSPITPGASVLTLVMYQHSMLIHKEYGNMAKNMSI